jgi:hypothetical protein
MLEGILPVVAPKVLWALTGRHLPVHLVARATISRNHLPVAQAATTNRNHLLAERATTVSLSRRLAVRVVAQATANKCNFPGHYNYDDATGIFLIRK